MGRLLLFDIDGTLVAGGPPKGTFGEALQQTYGTTGPVDDWEFSGKTDPQIARELLREAGLADPDIEAGFEDLWPRYVRGLQEALGVHPMERLPGIGVLLDGLRESVATGQVALGLVTGNLQAGAVLKLQSAGLDWDATVGGYGSDHEERDRLPGIAVARAWGHWRHRYAPDEVVIIGDTPRDVRCGRAHGARTVAVATGRYSMAQLQAAGADWVLPDLSSTEAVVRLLTVEA
jgi:phosphoglycolate phosphatase